MGVEIISPSSSPSSSPATSPASSPGTPAANGGLKPAGPPNATPLPAIEAPTTAPDTVNAVADKPQPAAQTPSANGKKTKPAFDKGDESSSKHPKKKGLKKLNPF